MKTRNLLFAIVAAAFALSGCSGSVTARPEISDVRVQEEKDKQQELALREHKRQNERLYSISFPLQAAAAGLCPEENIGYGAGFLNWSLNDLSSESRPIAASKLGLTSARKITHLVDGSPAATHLQLDDKILSIDGDTVGSNNFGELWGKHSKDGMLSLAVLRQEEEISVSMPLTRRCDFPVVMGQSNAINAYADGEKVVIHSGMMDLADDSELAAVIAHEIAHNVEKHVDKTRTNALAGGIAGAVFGGLLSAATGCIGCGDFGLSDVGAAAGAQQFSQEFEFEADYIALYIMARANMDLDEVPNLWRKIAVKNPGGIEKNYSGTHPSSPERFVHMAETIEEIKQKIASNEPLLPNRKE